MSDILAVSLEFLDSCLFSNTRATPEFKQEQALPEARSCSYMLLIVALQAETNCS
jgi:hypothetical protein